MIKKKNILITGINGFLGSNLNNLLSKYNYNIYGTSQSKNNNNNDSVYYLDLKNFNNIEKILNGIDALIHCAGIAHTNIKNKNIYQDINYQGTINLYDKCEKYKVKKFIFISSINVCVSNLENLNYPINEDTYSNNLNNYSNSKKMAEDELISKSKKYTCQLIILRPGLIYGPNVKGNFRNLLKLLNLNIPLPFNNCKNKRDLISVFNFSVIINKIISKEKLNHKIYNISDNDNIDFHQLLILIKKNLNKKYNLFFKINSKFLYFIFIIFGQKKTYYSLYNNLKIDTSRLFREIDQTSFFSTNYAIRKTCTDFLKTKNDKY